MKRALLLLMLAAAVPAQAQVKTPAAINGCQYYTGLSLSNYQVAPLSCDSTGALRISGTINATSAINATATLPTLSSGSQAPQGSLAGATYVQPVFGSASGGGSQVDGTHGLPVNIIAGGTASASVGATGAAVPSSADYGGMNVSGTLTGLVGTANGLKVDGSAVTQPISAASLPLPSGAATSANQTGGTQVAQPITTVTNSALVKGTGTQTSTTSTSLIAAVTSQRIYVTNASCSNSGASASLVLFQDGSGGTTLGTMQVPAGGGYTKSGTFPLFWTTAGNALFFAPQTSTTTMYCDASGYSSSN